MLTPRLETPAVKKRFYFSHLLTLYKDDMPFFFLHCPKSSLGNILAQKFSQPAWGQYRFSLRKFSNIQGRNTSNLWENFPPMIST
jgi:hypothetical protein